MNNLFKDFKNKVERTEFPEERIDKAFKTAIREAKPKRRKLKKLIYFTNAAALFVSLLFGSAFVSPTMANKLASTPVIGPLFEQTHSSGLILEALEEKGYKTDSIVYQYWPDKVVQIYIDGTDTYIQEIKDDIKIIVEKILQSHGSDAFSVKVQKVMPMEVPEVSENHSELVGIKYISPEEMPEFKQE